MFEKNSKSPLRRLVAVLLLTVTMISVAAPVSAASSAVNSRIRQLLYYYQYHQDAAETDIARLIDEITELDPDQGDKWRRIMDFWSWMNREMEKVPDCLPDGLPEDNSLCIVVFGYALLSDGSMKSELVGRLQTALNSAEKYPNAYILCTGGGTAADNSNVTEAGQMARWLIAHGIDESRIIRESSSHNTAQNARYSCRLLREKYPQVTSLALVTSSYHIRRGCLVFNTESVLSDSGLEIVGNAIYLDNRGVTETYTYQGYEISQLLSVGYKENAAVPSLCKLERISVQGQPTYALGEEIQYVVTAHYNNGYSRDVTAKAAFTPVDFGIGGVQTTTITYSENKKTATADYEFEILIPETEPEPTETEPPLTEPEPAAAVTEPMEAEVNQPGFFGFLSNLWDSFVDLIVP